MSVRLNVPEQSRDDLSVCATHPNELNQWVAALPLANTQETAKQLEQAAAEIAILNVAPDAKLAFLEALRPTVHYICTRLDRQSLAQQSQRADHASTAQRLQSKLCTGYKSVVYNLLSVVAAEEGETAGLRRAIHRLISDMSRMLLRSLQHYIPAPNLFWLELNQLYRLSEEQEFSDFRQVDEENHSERELSIAESYLRALLLATCKPNQLKQQQLSMVFNAIESWSKSVELTRDTEDALLCVDLETDRGPQFAKLMSKTEEPRALRTEVLAYEIEAYLKKIESSVTIPESLPNTLLEHLAEAWSVMQARAYRRLAASGPIRVCIGLRACHYFLSGGVEFTNQISGTEALLRREVNPFLDVKYETADGGADDPWSQAHDLKVRIPTNPNIEDPDRILLRGQGTEPPPVTETETETAASEPQPDEPQYHHYETEAVDTSPGGYCIKWVDALPSSTQVGELIALREERDARWCVATIRWIRHAKDSDIMGVELLSPRAIPVAIRRIHKRGGPTDFSRALLLPEIDAIGLSATLVTPRVPFSAGQKLHIQRQGIQTTGQLTEIQLNTESFNQFTFRMLDGYLENSRGDSNMGDLSEMTREDST